MKTLSQLPWNSIHQPNGGAIVRDAVGNQIANVKDARDADEIVERVNKANAASYSTYGGNS